MLKKALKAAGILVGIELVIVLIAGLIGRWNTSNQFSDAISLAGYINMVLGALSIIGNVNNRFNAGYLATAQRLGRNKADLMEDEQDSTYKSFRFLIVMFIAGLINVLIGGLL